MNIHAMHVISHRGRIDGEEAEVPGNTLAAFDMLLDRFPHIGVETDVRLTHGGLLVVAHDNLLQNFTNGSGFVNQLQNLRELAVLRVKCAGQITDYGVPELEEVLQLFAGRGVLHLEIKDGPDDPPGVLAAVLEVLKRHPKQKVWIGSFNHDLIKQVPPELPINVPSNIMPLDIISYLRQFTTGGRTLKELAFHPDLWNLTGKALAALQDAGVTVNAYTVPPSMFQWCLDHGVNPITDYAAAALEFLGQGAPRI
jgi:glycerophosphoryl diester phosphodiesterase